VIVAEGNEGTHLQAQLLSDGSLHQPVLHNGGVLALHHEEAFLDLDVFESERRDGKWIQAKSGHQAEALGMHGAVVCVGAEIDAAAVGEEQGLFQFRKQHDAADRRLGGGDEERMIAPAIHAGDRGRGESADAVGLQPLAARAGIEVGTDLGVEADHVLTL
jgi:hypothetical protein